MAKKPEPRKRTHGAPMATRSAAAPSTWTIYKIAAKERPGVIEAPDKAAVEFKVPPID
jgi:hypothetical protein